MSTLLIVCLKDVNGDNDHKQLVPHVTNLSSIITVEHLQVVMLYRSITDEHYKSFTAMEQGASRHKYKLPTIITMYIYLSDSCLNIMSCTIFYIHYKSLIVVRSLVRTL